MGIGGGGRPRYPDSGDQSFQASDLPGSPILEASSEGSVEPRHRDLLLKALVTLG